MGHPPCRHAPARGSDTLDRHCPPREADPDGALRLSSPSHVRSRHAAPRFCSPPWIIALPCPDACPPARQRWPGAWRAMPTTDEERGFGSRWRLRADPGIPPPAREAPRDLRRRRWRPCAPRRLSIILPAPRFPSSPRLSIPAALLLPARTPNLSDSRVRHAPALLARAALASPAGLAVGFAADRVIDRAAGRGEHPCRPVAGEAIIRACTNVPKPSRPVAAGGSSQTIPRLPDIGGRHDL